MEKNLLPGFSIQRIIGKGSYGTVYKVIRMCDQQSYALKVVELGGMNKKQVEDSINEIRIMASVQSPFIVSFHEATMHNEKLNIITEYAQLGDLSGLISRRRQTKKHFKEDYIWMFMLQMLQGLRILHDYGIIHRDLKSANILLSAPDLFKIADLGISTVLEKRQLAHTQIGTPMYLAPEIWKNRPYDSKCDIWSLGVLLYEMATFDYPYVARNAKDLSIKVCSSNPPKMPSFYSKELYRVIMLMLSKNPINRPSVNELLALPCILNKMHMINSFSSLIEQSSTNLIDTIKVTNALDCIQLPSPRYIEEECEPLTERMRIKDDNANLLSTKDLQRITDCDNWSPKKKANVIREENMINDIEFKPRPPQQRKIATPPPDPPKNVPPRMLRYRFRSPLLIR